MARERKIGLRNLLFSPRSSSCNITQIGPVGYLLTLGHLKRRQRRRLRGFSFLGGKNTADPTRTKLLKIHVALVRRPYWKFKSLQKPIRRHLLSICRPSPKKCLCCKLRPLASQNLSEAVEEQKVHPAFSHNKPRSQESLQVCSKLRFSRLEEISSTCTQNCFCFFSLFFFLSCFCARSPENSLRTKIQSATISAVNPASFKATGVFGFQEDGGKGLLKIGRCSPLLATPQPPPLAPTTVSPRCPHNGRWVRPTVFQSQSNL